MRKKVRVKTKPKLKMTKVATGKITKPPSKPAKETKATEELKQIWDEDLCE